MSVANQFPVENSESSTSIDLKVRADVREAIHRRLECEIEEANTVEDVVRAYMEAAKENDLCRKALVKMRALGATSEVIANLLEEDARH